jgi:DNA-binding transcriptional LysR family regulator
MMDGYLIRYFLAVAERGNFSKAAVHLNVTQPTLSAGIAKLETQLGVRLFERTNRLVSLTDAGSRFLVRARRIVREFELAHQEITGASKAPALRLGVLSTVPTHRLEDFIAEHRGLPDAQALEIFDGSERDLISRLERGRLDVALTILRPNQRRFRQKSLWREPYVLAVAESHSVAYADYVNPEALAGERMIIRRHCEVLAETSRYFTANGVRPGFALKTTNDDRALALVRADLGVTVMPESFIGVGVRSLRLKDFNMEREIGLLYASSPSATT